MEQTKEQAARWRKLHDDLVDRRINARAVRANEGKPEVLTIWEKPELRWFRANRLARLRRTV